MKNKKVKSLVLSLIAVMAISATPVFAATNTSAIKEAKISAVKANAVKTKSIYYKYALKGTTLIMVDASGKTHKADIKKSVVGIKARVIKGDPVYCVQMLLNMNGANLAVDGIIGKYTNGAIMTFQKKFGLKVTGIVDGATYSALIKNLR